MYWALKKAKRSWDHRACFLVLAPFIIIIIIIIIIELRAKYSKRESRY